jgi:hypothetical protein
MRTFPICVLTILASVTWAVAQSGSCQLGKVSTLGHADGVALQRINFTGADEGVGATVFMPTTKRDEIPDVVISHSAVVGNNTKADMLKFALALARAGAAVIVIDGTFVSPGSLDGAQSTRHLTACAGEWLQQKTKADHNHIALVAPEAYWSGWTGGEPWSPYVGVGFPQRSNARDPLIMEDFRSSADSLQHWLGLNEIDSEWLAGIVEEVSTATAR